MTIRHLIESHFSLVLLLACATGLLLPGIDTVPDASASVALAMLTYASCFKLRDGGVRNIRWRDIALFYVARYVLLPLSLYALSHWLVPEYAMAVFLLALVPAAVSSPAFTHMFGGMVPPAFAIVISSTLLAPLMIPLMFFLLGEPGISPSPLPLFRTLAFCILLPMALYAATRRFERLSHSMYQNVKVISIVLVAFVIALVVAKQREVILGDIPALIPLAACSLGCFVIFLLFGRWLARHKPAPERITYMACSGFNNVALGVSLALLHFPPLVILFVAVSEMAWASVPLLMKWLTRASS